MPQKMLSMKSLPLLADGALSEAVDRALRDVHRDLEERPTMDKERKVTITLSFMPNVLHEQSTHLEDVRCGFKVKTGVPDLGPVQVHMSPKQDGLAFHPDVAENAEQMSIMDAIDRQ